MSSHISPGNQDARMAGKDSISAYDPQFTVVTSSAVLTAPGSVFTIAPGEIGVIENVNNAVLLVKLGPAASGTSYNKALKACAAAGDGTGGAWIISNYVGEVSVFSATTYSYLAYKLQ
jgi:hypothetical protein